MANCAFRYIESENHISAENIEHFKRISESKHFDNNAGIEREFRVKNPGLADDFLNENEIETNLTAPIHLTFLLLPQLLTQREAAVVNVSSGLGFVPIAVMPIYCATKAALQSFSKSLRYQLKETNVKVFDVAPPLVETELHGC